MKYYRNQTVVTHYRGRRIRVSVKARRTGHYGYRYTAYVDRFLVYFASSLDEAIRESISYIDANTA